MTSRNVSNHSFGIMLLNCSNIIATSLGGPIGNDIFDRLGLDVVDHIYVDGQSGRRGRWQSQWPYVTIYALPAEAQPGTVPMIHMREQLVAK